MPLDESARIMQYRFFDITRLDIWTSIRFFAAEDEGKTEDPTEHKLKKSREEGKVAKSSEVVAAIVMLLPIIAIAFLSGYLLDTFIEMLTFYFGQIANYSVSSTGVLAQSFFSYFIRLTWPTAAIAFFAAVIANIIQVGFLFTTKTITPDFSKLVPNLPQFFKRSFFSKEAAFNLAKSLVKVFIIGIVAFINISGEINQISNLIRTPFWQAVTFIMEIALRIFIESAILMLFLSLPDYFFQRYQHKEQLKMSKQEVKEERKQLDGDPLIKNKLRERRREMLGRNMIKNVPEADVVITNPTHFAIALGWDGETMEAPTVIAKGQDELALKIKDVAQQSEVPVVENKPLARALYDSVEIGDAIPEQYWEVVSRVLAEVYKMNGAVASAV